MNPTTARASTVTHRNCLRRMLPFLVASMLLLSPTHAYRGRIEPGAASECVTETLLPGGLIGVSFEVTSGGAKDIDATLAVTYLEPTGTHSGVLSADHTLVTRQLTAWSKTTSGSFEYTAPVGVSPPGASAAGASLHGAYPYKVALCFSNAASRWTPKWVTFSFVKQETHLEDTVVAKATAEHEMEVLLHEDGQQLFHLQTQMVKVKAMEEQHRATIEAANTWIMVGAVLNGGLLTGMSVFQYYYLTRFLSVRSGGVRL